MDPAIRASMDAIRRIVRVLRQASRDAERTLGVSGAQLFVLNRLLAQGPRTINELAADTATHQSSVSVVVQRLVERGLVSRAVAAHDARRREVSVTAAGRRLLRKAPTAAQERLISGLQQLPPAAGPPARRPPGFAGGRDGGGAGAGDHVLRGGRGDPQKFHGTPWIGSGSRASLDP